jgi:nucleoside-diphosphate-sugar epimerase
MSKKLFVTGGAGYVGSMLVPYLLAKGHQVKVFDTLYFGKEFLPKHKNLKIVKGDIRNSIEIERESEGYDTFVNLACISNDASYVLDEKLSKTINYDAFEPMVVAAKKAGVKRFIYASTSSVYGVSNQKDVKEDHPLVPLTLYNKFKGLCEPLLFKHTNSSFEGVVFRPATVCGYAPRLRLDLSVNILSNYAYFKNEITVFGGKQLRPNLNIKDYCDVVDLFINADRSKIENKIFNVGYENMTILDLAELVKNIFDKRYNKIIDIVRTESNDNRSYHINSDKIKDELGFKPSHSISDAINSLFDAFENNLVPNSFDDDIYFNVKRMQNLNIK